MYIVWRVRTHEVAEVYVLMRVSKSIIHTHTHTHTFTHTHTHTHLHIHTRICTYADAHTEHTRLQTYICTSTSHWMPSSYSRPVLLLPLYFCSTCFLITWYRVGRKGWTTRSRRSISWLLYLCDENWTLENNGGTHSVECCGVVCCTSLYILWCWLDRVCEWVSALLLKFTILHMNYCLVILLSWAIINSGIFRYRICSEWNEISDAICTKSL